MSPAQTPSPTAADRCEQPDQTVAAGGARPDELETPVKGKFGKIVGGVVTPPLLQQLAPSQLEGILPRLWPLGRQFGAGVCVLPTPTEGRVPVRIAHRGGGCGVHQATS